VRTFVASVVVVAALAACAGCSGDDGSAADPTKTSATATSVTPSTPVGTEDEIRTAVIAAYRLAWDVFIDAGNPPDPDDPRLRDALSGRALEATRRQLAAYDLEGVGLRGSFDPQDPQVTLRRGVHAEVEDCNVDRAEAFNLETGEVVDAATGQSVATHADLVYTEGRWRVYAFNQGARDCSTAS
jgi:hypothetical protein